jgi:phosphatidylglycerol:prolipoprotein diacylglycerol transferase
MPPSSAVCFWPFGKNGTFMCPILFRWRGLTVWSYPAMLYLGLVLGVAAGNIAAHDLGINAFRVFVATLVLVVPALLGARLLYVASHWKQYRHEIPRIWNRREGGFAMYGGLPVVLVLSAPLLRGLQLGFGAFWDVATFTILVGMIFTRIGCLLQGCCAGQPAENWLSQYLPNYRGEWKRRMPCQLLEAAWAAVLLIVATAVRRSLPFAGALFLAVAAGYGGGRLVFECIRERERGSGVFTIHSAISLLVALFSIATLTVFWRK